MRMEDFKRNLKDRVFCHDKQYYEFKDQCACHNDPSNPCKALEQHRSFIRGERKRKYGW